VPAEASMPLAVAASTVETVHLDLRTAP